MSEEKNTNVTVGTGITLGSALAVGLSWYINHSVGYAILHFFLGWFYVIYALCQYSEKFF